MTIINLGTQPYMDCGSYEPSSSVMKIRNESHFIQHVNAMLHIVVYFLSYPFMHMQKTREYEELLDQYRERETIKTSIERYKI